MSPRAVSPHKDGAYGSALPLWTKNAGSERSETSLVAISHRAHLTKKVFISEGSDIARSKNNTSHELGELPLARPAQIRSDLRGSYRKL